jgi:hypothetical protein
MKQNIQDRCEVGKGPGEAVDLVHHNGINSSRSDIVHQPV